MARPHLLILILIVVAAGFSFVGGASADHPGEPFDEARFRALQEDDALVLVDVSASWCPTCAKQAEIISRYRDTHPEVPLHVLRVDFDDQKEWVRYFKAPRQSTLALYRGSEQVWFAVAETREEKVFKALDDAHKKAAALP
jgi:thioredoxin 1